MIKGGGVHFDPNFVQAAFAPKNWDKRLKFCMQPLILVIYVDHEDNLRSEVIDLHFDIQNAENMGKYHFFPPNSHILN